VADDLLAPKPPVGITRGLIRQRDKAHVGSIFLNRDIDDEFEDVVRVVVRARADRRR